MQTYYNNPISSFLFKFIILTISPMFRRLITTSARTCGLIGMTKRSLGLMVFRTQAYFATHDPKAPNLKKPQTAEQDIKQQGRQFYENQVEKIIQLKSSKDLQSILTSSPEAIILDLYADWCGPCKTLTPRLQQKVQATQNVKMIKINIDKFPEIATALTVKSVPSVFLFYQGQPVDKFEGNVGQNQFNKFFQTIAKLTGVSVQNKEAVATLQTAKKLLGQGKYNQSIQVLQKFSQKKIGQDLIAVKQLLLSQGYLSVRKVAKLKDSLARAAKHQAFYNQVPDLKMFYTVLKQQLDQLVSQATTQNPELVNLKAKIEKATNPDDKLEAKFELVNYYKAKQMSEEALAMAMDIIKQDKSWKDKKTNQLVLAIFKQLGNNSPVVQKYRKILQRILS